MADEAHARAPYVYGGEVFIRDTTYQEACEWATSLVGQLTVDLVSSISDERTELYSGTFSGGGVAVMLDAVDDNGEWREIMFSSEVGGVFPWADEVELARRAYAHFRRVVRCSAQLYFAPYTGDLVVQIDSDGEDLVEW